MALHLDPVASLVQLPALLHLKPEEPGSDILIIPLVVVTKLGINILQVCYSGVVGLSDLGVFL